MATTSISVGLLVLTSALVGLSAVPTASAHFCSEGVFGDDPNCNGHICPEGNEPHMHMESDEAAECINFQPPSATQASSFGLASWLLPSWFAFF